MVQMLLQKEKDLEYFRGIGVIVRIRIIVRIGVIVRIGAMSAQFAVFLGSESVLAMEYTGTSKPSAPIAFSAPQGPCIDAADLPASAAAETCSGSVATRSRRDLAGFGIQYWGEDYTAETLAAAPHRALIIEASVHGADVGLDLREKLFSAEEVSVIRQGGRRPVFAYLNVGELAPYRSYWVDAFGAAGPPGEDSNVTERQVPAWYGGVSEEGEHLAAFWTPEWLEVLRHQIDAFLERGYDGVFLDDVLHYYTWGDQARLKSLQAGGRTKTPKNMSEFARDMMALVLQVGMYARHDAPLARPEFALIVNGGAYIGWDAASQTGASEARDPLFDRYVDALDAIAMESALGMSPDCATVEALQQNYAAMDVPVLSIDFHSRHPLVPIDQFRAQIARLANSFGFLPYVAADELFNRLDPPILPEAAAATGEKTCDQAESARGGCAPCSD
jgi:uncharacterized protein (TIGR01370 family)